MTPVTDLSTRGPIVWLPMALRGVHSSRDLSGLEAFGEIRCLYPQMERFAPSLRPDVAFHEMATSFADFDPAQDYVCYVGGDPLAGIILGALLMGSDARRFTFLRYSRDLNPDGSRAPTGKYIPTVVSLDYIPGTVVEEDSTGSAASLA